MITYCQYPFLLKDGHDKSSNILKKMQEYSTNEMRFFYHFFEINNMLHEDLLNNEGLKNINYIEQMRNSVLKIICYIADEDIDGFIIEKNKKYLRDSYYEYITNLKNGNYSRHIEIINNAIKFLKKRIEVSTKYSFDSAYDIFKKNNLDKENVICSIKMMLFSKDYFNIEKIYKLRERIISSKIYTDLVEKFFISKAPEKDILSILFSDYMIIEQAVAFAYNPYKFNLNNNDELQYFFDFSCILLYCRFILDMYIFIGQCDCTGFFDKNRIEILISKIYNMLNFIIYDSIHEYLSINEHVYFLTTTILDDVCLHAQTKMDIDKVENAFRLGATIARTPARTRIDEAIDEICMKSMKKWNDGSPFDHIDMIGSFKNMKKYSSLFAEKNFEKKLNDRIKQICKENNIRRIRGTDIHVHKRKKRPEKSDR